ncbi:MAG TPA: hypothetical protein PLY87_00080 [Planctomycetaceae bacterium]|jgi:hypothetical protein|nr:hypothetical protein [Planctomycetaceae bacterium]HQZ63432.1 hypothetical protein [Planctomycetaceae bacterium]
MMTTWTHRELDIVDAHTRRVRMMTLSQIGQVWWPELGSQNALRNELKRLCEGGLLKRTIINAHPRLTIQSPVSVWQPSQTEPDIQRVAERVRSRWRYGGEPTEVYWASTKAANLFGSGAGQLPNVLHRDHDLLLSEVYVFYRLRRPDVVHRWASEDVFPKAGFRIKNPDAFLFDDSGHPMRVVESAGRYGIRQIESFHQHCVERDLPYELW